MIEFESCLEKAGLKMYADDASIHYAAMEINELFNYIKGELEVASRGKQLGLKADHRLSVDWAFKITEQSQISLKMALSSQNNISRQWRS